MGRIRSRASSAHPADLSALSPAKQQPHKRRRKNAYKVVLESVTQKRKKLRLTATFDQQAPPGYTFIGFGNAKLTAQCKEFCRKRGELAYSVSAPPKNNATADPEKISFHVNRLGFYFPNKIVDLAMEWLGIQVNGARPRSQNGSGFTRGLGRRLKQHTNLSEEDQVRAAMRDLFPKMPEDSLEAIVEHAFAEGAKRVGNATNLSLERRVQMAVLAHVRHKHTEYDKLLKEVGYIQARKAVENPCIEKILTWRGENLNEDDDVVEMEDDFREVIVLDDSDASDGEDDGAESDSESSVEYAPAPNVRPSAGNMPRGRLPMASTHATTAPRPRSLVEPLSSPRLGYDRLHERPMSYVTTHHQEAAPLRATPRGLVQIPRTQQGYDPYIRNVPHELPYRERIHDLGGHHHAEPFIHDRNTEQGPHDEVPLVRVARYAAEPLRGQHASRSYANWRLPPAESYRSHMVDRAEHGPRHHGEPRPEDVIVPSIERDEPSSAPPTIGNGPPRYISHQERSLMQEPPMQEQAGPQPYRTRQAADEQSRRIPQGAVIDLTDSPGRALGDFHVGGRQPVTVESLDTGSVQHNSLSIDERYRSRRQMEHDANFNARTAPKQSVPSKRWSGDFLPDQLDGCDDRHSYPARRRLDEGPLGPGRTVGAIDSPGPSQRPRIPVVPEHLVTSPRAGRAGRDYYMAPSPTRMRSSRAYDHIGTTGIRMQPNNGYEYRASPRTHYYDYRPANGDSYR